LSVTGFAASFCNATIAKIPKAVYPRRGGKSVGARLPMHASSKFASDSSDD
jgi:hypothetical protein